MNFKIMGLDRTVVLDFLMADKPYFIGMAIGFCFGLYATLRIIRGLDASKPMAAVLIIAIVMTVLETAVQYVIGDFTGLTSTGIELSGVAATDFAAAFRLRVSLALFAASLRFLAATFAFRVAAAFTAAWLRFMASAFALRVAAPLFAAALRFRVAAALLAAALRSVGLFIVRSITGKDDPGVVQSCLMPDEPKGAWRF